jgi:aspartate racemase
MHIGLIGGIGPAATHFYHRALSERHAASGRPLELTIAHADVHELVRNHTNRDPQKQARIFAGLVQRLKTAGAAAAAITSMGGHFCVTELEALSALPIVNAIPAVDLAIRQRKLRTVGILGTRVVMDTGLYGGIVSAAVVRPAGAALDEIHSNYIEMATTGRVTSEQRRVFFEAGRRLCADQGAEAVLLGGTDLFLAFEGQDCGFAVLDCADVHVEAIFQTWSAKA